VTQLRDVMTTEVLTTSAERPVAAVTGLMVKARVGSAIVMQGPWLAGILTERDVLRAAASGFGSHQVAGFTMDDQRPSSSRARHHNRRGHRCDAGQWVSPPSGCRGPRTQGCG
jgi:predicted transcriptional regulator